MTDTTDVYGRRLRVAHERMCGYSYRQIASRLNLPLHTVRNDLAFSRKQRDDYIKNLNAGLAEMEEEQEDVSIQEMLAEEIISRQRQEDEKQIAEMIGIVRDMSLMLARIQELLDGGN